MAKQRRVNDILGPGKEDELLQSFVRVGLKAEEDENVDHKKESAYEINIAGAMARAPRIKKSTSSPTETADKPKFRSRKARIDSEALKKRKPKESFIEFYTDKDRAAAVSAGSYDIKQSLKLKRKQDRHEAILIPEEADPSSLIALGLKEIKSGNVENAIHNITKALELSGSDLNALIARSKCYLLLGEPSKALEDAETALGVDKNSIRAIYQKAESLYYLGKFEQSLMFFHRGLRARPELTSFRLGVQKTQEAIENTIGASQKPGKVAKPKKLENLSKQTSSGGNATGSATGKLHSNRAKISKKDQEKRNCKKLLGELCVDKEYLENLLKHPDLIRADTNTENISLHAKEAVEFLNKRQEFWRQQRPCTALPNTKHLGNDVILGWF